MASWGVGDLTAHTVPAPVTLPTGTPTLVQLGAGANISCALDQTGHALCWGRNDLGQLGQGDTMQRTAPAPVDVGATRLLSLATGYSHVCATATDHSLYCWGTNGEGQIGLDDGAAPMTTVTRPTVVPGNSWMQVAIGDGHTCGLRQPGTLHCWGRNTAYQLGLGAIMPVQIRTPTGAPRSRAGGNGHGLVIRRRRALSFLRQEGERCRLLHRCQRLRAARAGRQRETERVHAGDVSVEQGPGEEDDKRKRSDASARAGVAGRRETSRSRQSPRQLLQHHSRTRLDLDPGV